MSQEQTCPPCNDNCNQGRACPARKQSGVTGIEFAIYLMALAAFGAYITPMVVEPEPRCWNGWLYDGQHGRQVFNENGGGIPCTVKRD